MNNFKREGKKRSHVVMESLMCSYRNSKEKRLWIRCRKYKRSVFLVKHCCLGTNILVPVRLEIYSHNILRNLETLAPLTKAGQKLPVSHDWATYCPQRAGPQRVFDILSCELMNFWKLFEIWAFVARHYSKFKDHLQYRCFIKIYKIIPCNMIEFY